MLARATWFFLCISTCKHTLKIYTKFFGTVRYCACEFACAYACMYVYHVHMCVYGCMHISGNLSVCFSTNVKIWLTHMTYKYMQIIACVSYVVRVVAYSLFTDPWMILIVEPLHGVTFAFLQLASVHYVAHLAPPGKPKPLGKPWYCSEDVYLMFVLYKWEFVVM
jgi:hypothetical protein